MIRLPEVIAVFLITSTFIVGFSMVYVLYRKASPATKPFAFICATVAIYLFGYAMELSCVSLESMKFWNLFQYFGIPFIPAFWLLFALSYNDSSLIRLAWFRAAIFIVPILTFILRCSNNIHHLYYADMLLKTDGAFPVMLLKKGPFYYFNVVFVSACLLYSNMLFILSAIHQRGRKKNLYFLLVAGSSLPWLTVILNGIDPGDLGIDYTALVYPVSCVLILFIVFQEQFLKLKPRARELVFESTEDALIVFDEEGQVADFNPAAARILPGLGKPDTTAGPAANEPGEIGPAILAGIAPGNPPIQLPLVVSERERYYDAKASFIVDESGKTLGTIVTLNDITRITEALQSLAEKEKKLRTVTETIREAFWLRSATTGLFLYASPAFEKIWGQTIGSLYADPETFLKVVHPEDSARVRSWFASAGGAGPSDIEFRLAHGNGKESWVWIRSSPVRDDAGSIVQYAGIGVDITERKRMEKRIESGDRILDAINRTTSEFLMDRDLPKALSGGLALIGEATGADRAYLVENTALEDLTGPTEALKLEWKSGLRPAPAADPFMQKPATVLVSPILDELSAGKVFAGVVSELPEGELKTILEDRAVISILLLPILTNGALWGFLGFDECGYRRVWSEAEISLLSTFADSITKTIERKAYESKIEYMSLHDSLTGLYNRAWFDMALQNSGIVDALPLTIVMADVNGLKLTNDAFGHAAGDTLLRRAATVMSLECGPKDRIARTGGDEFVILLPETDSRETGLLVSRIRARAETFRTETGILSISFGWETRAELERQPDEVLKAAEDAMYRRKQRESLLMRHSMISLIMKTLYAKNERERKHSERVGELCAEFGKRLRMDSEKVKELKTAGLMHDIGKIGVADSILAKREEPEESEWVQLRRHPEIGFRILGLVNEYSRIASWVLAHHERWDGKGYPNGLSGSKIPLQARIIAIADTWDAMIYDRPYQAAMPRDKALQELAGGSGSQFDPELTDVFLAMMGAGQT